MEELEQTFRIDIYDRNRQWVAPLGPFQGLTGTKRFDNVSDFEVRVKATHNRLAQLLEPGARLRLRLRGETFIEGPIRSHNAAGPGPGIAGEFRFGVEDNFRILRNFLIYQVPGGTMAEQAGSYHYEDTGPAETVFKNIAGLNILSRTVEPVTIAPDLGRGPTITSSARMATIYNEMFPLLESLNLGVKVDTTPEGLILDVYEPGVFPNKLTESSRIVRKWTYDMQAPDVTHVVVGGNGDGATRNFYELIDTEREALWGDRIEVFVDARDAPDPEASLVRATESLFDGRGAASMKVKLAETRNFQFGGEGGLKVGQQVTCVVANGTVEVTDILREVDFSWDVESGLDINAQIGRVTDPTMQMISAITRLSSSVSKLKASK